MVTITIIRTKSTEEKRNHCVGEYVRNRAHTNGKELVS